MDPQAGTSFIPKKPLTGGVSSASGMGLVLLGAILFFILSVAAAGGAFAYKLFLEKAIASKDDTLARAEGAFDISVVEDLSRIDNRMREARTLLASHVAPSAIFNLLSAETLESVQFTTFGYALQEDGSGSISLSGKAGSFSAVALQSDRFGGSKMLKEVVFSDITIDQAGGVGFSVQATVVPEVMQYSRLVAQGSVPAIPQVEALPVEETDTTLDLPTEEEPVEEGIEEDTDAELDSLEAELDAELDTELEAEADTL